MENRIRQRVLGVIVLAACWSGWFGADASAMVITQTLTSSSSDTMFRSTATLDSTSTNWAAGIDTTMRVGQVGWDYRSLIEFDLSQLATNVNEEVRSAFLQLRIVGDPAPSDGDFFISAYRMNAPWAESDVDINNGLTATTGATWIYPDKANTGTTWLTPGILGGADAQGTATDSIDIEDTGERFTIVGTTGSWVQWDVTADLQAIGNGTATNFGWLLVADELEAVLASFGTRENVTIAPRLVISMAVPEPASIGLLSAGFLLHIFIRRGRIRIGGR